MAEPYILIRHRSSQEYHERSIRLRKEALSRYEGLKNRPKTFRIDRLDIDIELSYSDVKNIVGKATRDEKFNAIKNALARDIEGYLKKATYEGWRPTKGGKHSESAYFTYYSRRLGAKTYLCLRKMKGSEVFKPYAIISQPMYDAESANVRNEKPPR